MFICKILGKQTKMGDKMRKLIVIDRQKVYTATVINEETRQPEEVFVAEGREVVKEIGVSEEGELTWNSWSPEDKRLFLLEQYPHLMKNNFLAQTK